MIFIVGDKDVWDMIENVEYLVLKMNNVMVYVIKNVSYLLWFDVFEESV